MSVTKFILEPNKYLFLELIVLISLFLILYKWQPFGLVDRYPALINLFWLIVIFLMTVSYFFVRQKALEKFDNSLNDLFIKGCATLAGIFTIVALVILFVWGIYQFPDFYTFVLAVLNILIFAGFLGAIYLLFKKYGPAAPDNPYIKFFKNVVLYIPCVIIDVIEYFKYQYKITTRTVWILLGLEILLISLRFIIPYLFKKVIKLTTKNGTKLLNEPIYLNNKKALGSFTDESEEQDDDDEKSKINYHYCVSAWFYINPQPPNTSKAYTKYTNILNYGNKPRIQFNSLENTLRIQTELNNNKFITIYTKKNIDYQKWQNIVINYAGGTMDVFMNGELVASKPKIIPYMSHENVTTGADNGIHGGICNVVYYDKLLSKSDIMLNYKLLRDRRFPVL